MAVELMPSYSFTNKMEATSAQEAATAGLQTVENLVRLLSHSRQQNFPEQQSSIHQTADPNTAADYQAVSDVAVAAVNKFKKFISLLDRTPRTGHARFRRGPVSTSSPPTQQKIKPGHSSQTPKTDSNPPSSKIYCARPVQGLPPLPHQLVKNGSVELQEESTTRHFASPATSFISALAGDSDSLRPSFSEFKITNLSQVSPVGRPPLSKSSFKRKCSSMDDATTKCGSGSSRCHCPKKRKSRLKRVVRIPAITMKMVDIPPDDYSWRKYGQKPIKGSPHPRGYYKCSSERGCPARKHVERALDDPTMLIVTYEGEHNHDLSTTEAPAMVLESS